jgi:hypothetical protein
LSAFAALFLLMDGVVKLFRPAPVVEAHILLGIPVELAFPIGVLLLACLAVYLFPPTAFLGAVVLTGYLGGAVAIHMRAGSDTFSLVFPILLGALIWGGLYLRNTQVRALFSLRS